MTDSFSAVKDEREVPRRVRSRLPHEAEQISERIAVLDQILSALAAQLQVVGRNKRLKVNPRLKINLARVSLCFRRPIAARYQTPTESGSRRASSRS